MLPNNQGLPGIPVAALQRPARALHTVVINAALFPRQVFDRLRFDTNLKYGFDEVDITTQAVALGYEIVPRFDARQLPTIRRRSAGMTTAPGERIAPVRHLQAAPLDRRLKVARVAWVALAAGHLYAASVKRSGVAGIAEARQTVAQARASARCVPGIDPGRERIDQDERPRRATAEGSIAPLNVVVATAGPSSAAGANRS